ncbi:MAG: hypothetical protein R3B93_16670 [Bacteroidia bacterium]
MTNDYLVTDEVSPEVWVPNALYDNIFVYNENIHAVYGILVK